MKYQSSGYGVKGRNGFYIHGGYMKNRNGTYRFTHGCIRVTNPVLHWLYDFMPYSYQNKGWGNYIVKVRYGRGLHTGRKDGRNNSSIGGYHYSAYDYSDKKHRKIK